MSHSGHVFHPGHEELHGITVVVSTNTPRTLVGRYDAEQDGVVYLNDVSLHDSSRDSKSRAAFLSETKTYGVAVQIPRASIPRAQITGITRLGDLDLDAPGG